MLYTAIRFAQHNSNFSIKYNIITIAHIITIAKEFDYNFNNFYNKYLKFFAQIRTDGTAGIAAKLHKRNKIR